MPEIKKYFRNGNRLANIIAADNQTRLIEAVGIPLGQLSPAPGKSSLLATDEARSILGAKHALGFQVSRYSAYGHSAVENQATVLGYNGELLERFDFYLLGHGNRAYNTRLMRFQSPDRTGVFFKNNFNSYAYAAGDPIDYTDPSGNTPIFIKNGLRALGFMRPRSKHLELSHKFLILERHEFKSKKHFTSMGESLIKGIKEELGNPIDEFHKLQDNYINLIDATDTLNELRKVMPPLPSHTNPHQVKTLRELTFQRMTDYYSLDPKTVKLEADKMSRAAYYIRMTEAKLNHPAYK